jgi:uncharacterized protein YqgV (UPF0045/DUF77 family)
MGFIVTVESKYGVVEGDSMRDIIDIIPELEPTFKQRKSYDEYYFNPLSTQIEVTMQQIIELSKWYFVGFNGDRIVIKC